MKLLSWFKTKMAREFAHYLVLWATILGYWYFTMTYLTTNIMILSFGLFGIFVISDMILHKLFKI